MTTLDFLRQTFRNSLSGIYAPEEIDSFFYSLTEAYLNLNRLDVSLNRNRVLSVSEANQFELAMNRLNKQEPIQYIIGETEFFGFKLKVGPSVLIPRPETEELVQWILDDHGTTEEKELRVLDIGTGSGCIAIALAKKLTSAKVTAIDISDPALKLAEENAVLNNIEIEFKKADVLKISDLRNKFDIIVSNPPYVREVEKGSMSPNVLNFEPATALFVGDKDPLKFYRAIVKFAHRHLHTPGKVYLEINEYLSEELLQFLESEGFEAVDLKQDLFGKDRMIRCIREKTR